MPVSTEQPLITYLLHGLTRFDVVEIEVMEPKPAYFVTGRGGRGVLVSAEDPPNLLKIGRKLPGDNRDVVGGWLEQTEASRLVSEYRPTVTPEAQAEAIRAWKAVREHRVLLEHELRELAARRARLSSDLEDARQRERKAVEGVVRTHGKTMISVDGEFWELRQHRNGAVFQRCERDEDVEAK